MTMAKKWIANAIKRPGALRSAARQAGAMKGDKISQAWIRQQAGSSNKRRSAQAQLALNLNKMRRK
jgi:hypothetical protein